ncbi:MAG: DNA-processing protein DprA, partial [Candidatus Entotheonellia bacterium]
LEGAIAARETRQRILEGRLTLVTPFHPRTKFSVRAAMQRNKFIYGLAQYALVVASAQENGGTWAGAIENLKSGWVPLFVRMGTDVPEGNVHLLTKGALEFPDTLLARVQDLQQWFEEHAIGADRGAPIANGAQEEQQAAPVGSTATALTSHAPSATAKATATGSTGDLFAIVWPYIASELSEPRTEREIASHFALEVTQVKAWLTRALGEGLLQKLTRPVRYRLVEPQQTTPELQASLFDAEDNRA